MKINWHFDKNNGGEVSKLLNRKICDVYQKKSPSLIRWKGSFENGEFFLLYVIDGILIGDCGEREMMLEFDVKPLAHPDELVDMINETDGYIKIQKFIEAKNSFIDKFMKELTFEDIMNLFVWEYEQNFTEMYDEIIV